MITIYNFLINNIYLYICIIIALTILATILFIVCANQKNRKKIKNDFVEAEKVETELENIENSSKIGNLENILKEMQENVNLKPEDVVEKFEKEQEENAIISYQELVDNVKSGKIEVADDEESNINFVENLAYESEINEPIEAIEEIKETVTPQMVKDAVESISTSSIKEVPKKFKQSDFISPIYGVIDNSKLDYPTIKKEQKNNYFNIMNTNDYNELTEEIKKQEEFLNALKEFRNNL